MILPFLTLKPLTINEFSNSECNGRLQGITCSDMFEVDAVGADAQKYLMCPIDKSVCGDQKEYNLQKPNIIDSIFSTSIDLPSATLPPGYVCSYSIGLGQTTHNESDDEWMTEMIVKRPQDRREIENKNLSASLFWYTRSNDGDEPEAGHELELLGEACS